MIQSTRSVLEGPTFLQSATVPDLELELSIFRDHVQVKNRVDDGKSFCMEWFDDLIPKDHYDAIDGYFKDIIAIHEGNFSKRG